MSSLTQAESSMMIEVGLESGKRKRERKDRGQRLRESISRVLDAKKGLV